MIDATLRGENAGESDTRFIKKKKKILIKTIQGPKLSDFIKEVERYDMIKKGIEFDEEEIVESEDSDDDSSSSEEEESHDEDKKMPAKKKTKYSKIAAAHAAAAEKNKSSTTGKGNEGSSDSEDEMSVTSKSSKSSTLTNENSTLDGFSTSQASSSANNKLTKKEKKERKRLKKEKKRLKKEEKRKLKKERKRKEKEERKKKRKLEKQLEKKKKLAASAAAEGGGKKSKKKRKQEEDKKLAAAVDEDEEEVSVDNEDDESMEDASQQEESDNEEEGVDNEEDNDDEPTIYEIATKSDFDKYKADLLSRVPKAVKSRFREGGFSRWGKDWLPVLELGPFDVEPGPVRDMWLDMFDNTQESGRDMTRLVFWYGVKFEERSQAYSFVPESKIIPYEEGESKGYYKMPKKILNKIEKKQKLTKTEEQIKRGLAEIVSDMAKKKSERLSWMMKFKEDYELAAEEAEKEEARKKMKAAVSNEKKKKLGRPKKDDSTVGKKKLGRPKKSDKKMGRPKKSDGKKESTAKKWVMMNDDIETESDEDDNDYDEENDGSGDEGDMNVDDDSDDSDDDVVKAADKKRKASTSSTDKRKKNKRSKNMTEEERAIERKAKAAEYREKKAREKCEAQGLEYVKGRVGRKSKAVMLEEEQLKFIKCEEVFVPMMDKLTKAREESNVKRALKCINAINEKVDILTPPFLREYPLGMLVKQVRKSFEGTHPEVKDQCKSLTVEMKRVFNEKDPKLPDGFVPVKNRKSKPKESSTPVPKAAKAAKAVKSEKVAPKASVDTPKVDRVDSSTEPCMSKQNSEMSLSGKMTPAASSDCLPDAAAKSEPKQKKSFSLKGMFEKPKPAPKPKISVQAPSSSVISTQPSPKPTPKSLPSWVTGPAMKMEDFHEQHAKERTFGLEFLVDAASLVSSTKKFDPRSVSQSFELAIFAETKLRGRDWDQYWEKVHDVVAMLSPGTGQRNAILQGIIDGNYQDPSELVKLSRREIQSLNQLRG